MKLGTQAGPLGSYTNYINYIALSNFIDYEFLKQGNVENNRRSISDKFKEIRFFLNTAESFNNILDYFYYDNESLLAHKSIEKFRSAVHRKYPALDAVANIANAYKHCVRQHRGDKNPNLPWAKDLQKPAINLDIDLLNRTSELKFSFEWPIQEHEDALVKAFQFWADYINAPYPEEILNA